MANGGNDDDDTEALSRKPIADEEKNKKKEREEQTIVQIHHNPESSPPTNVPSIFVAARNQAISTSSFRRTNTNQRGVFMANGENDDDDADAMSH